MEKKEVELIQLNMNQLNASSELPHGDTSREEVRHLFR